MKSDLNDALSRLLRPLKNRMFSLVGRAVVSFVREDGAFQIIQAERLADETGDDLERFGAYGLASRPHPGAECIILSVGGVRSHGVVIAVEDRRYRMQLEAGEVALYDDQGQSVHLKRDGIRIESPFKVDVAAPDVTVTANFAGLDATEVEVTGNLFVRGDLSVEGNSVLGDGATLFVKLSTDAPATTVKAK